MKMLHDSGSKLAQSLKDLRPWLDTYEGRDSLYQPAEIDNLLEEIPLLFELSHGKETATSFALTHNEIEFIDESYDGFDELEILERCSQYDAEFKRATGVDIDQMTIAESINRIEQFLNSLGDTIINIRDEFNTVCIGILDCQSGAQHFHCLDEEDVTVCLSALLMLDKLELTHFENVILILDEYNTLANSE